MAIFQTRTGYGTVESIVFDRVIRTLAGPFHDYARAHIDPLIQPGMRVLDVGCGGGRFAIELVERHPDIRVVGIDLSTKLLGWAKGRGAPFGERLSFIEASALELPFEAGEFDLAYSLGSIKHWSDPTQGLREAVRVLVPGGRLWVIEGDRSARPEDVAALVRAWGFPRPVRRLGEAFFRTVVAGQAPDLLEARELVARLPELDGAAERAPGLPLLRIEGVVRDSEADSAVGAR